MLQQRQICPISMSKTLVRRSRHHATHHPNPPRQTPPTSSHEIPLCTNSQASNVLRNRSTSSTVNPIQILVHATSTLATKHLSLSVRFNNPARRKSHAHQIHEWPGPQTLYSEGSRSRSAAHFRNEILCRGIVCVDPSSGIPGC